MNLKTRVPKIGGPEHYLNKPFNDEKGNKIGIIDDCIEKDEYYELNIHVDDARFIIGSNQISFEIKGK